MTLAVPLVEAQVIAAGKLHDELGQWKAADRALDYLRKTMPSNTKLTQVLLKAAALNQLYRTNVFNLHPMAQHVVQVFSQEYQSDDDCLRVEKIAYLEASGQHHQSFASKYCHFFADRERFPLFDGYARRMVREHLGKGNYRCKKTDPRYRDFYADLKTLRDHIPFSPTVREMDRYLWLRGQREAFEEKGDEAGIGAEVRDLFETARSDQRVGTLIGQMCGL